MDTRCPLKTLKSLQISPSGVNLLKVLMNSDHDSFLTLLITFRHIAFAFLYSMKFCSVLCFLYLFLRVFRYLMTFLHSSFHQGAAFGLWWRVRVCGMCCVAASSMMSVNCVIVVSGCMRDSMYDVKLCQSAFLKFHLGKVESGAVC